RPNSFEGNCDLCHCRERPAIRFNFFQFIYSDKPNVATVLPDDEATTSCAHQIVFSKCTQIQVSIDGRTILRHHILHPDIRQRGSRLDSYVGGRRGVLQKPPNKREPQSTEISSGEETKESDHDECHSDGLSDTGGNFGGADRIPVNSPDD